MTECPYILVCPSALKQKYPEKFKEDQGGCALDDYLENQTKTAELTAALYPEGDVEEAKRKFKDCPEHPDKPKT